MVPTDDVRPDDPLDATGADSTGRRVTESHTVTEWEQVSRQYRRGPGGWWWLALLLVPLLLALLGLGLGGSDDDDDTADPVSTGSTDTGATSEEETSAPTTDDADASSDAAATDDMEATSEEPGADAGALPGPFSIARDGDSVTVSAEVPDETSKTALLAALQSRLGDGVTVVDEVTVVPDAVLPDPMGLAGLLDAGADVPDFGLDWDGAGALTLTGTAAAEEAKAAIETAAATVVPSATIDNQITVDPNAAGSGDGETAGGEGCAALKTESSALFEDTPITFETGGAELTEASTTVVGELATLIEGCERATVEVGGHTDNTGRAAFNDQLSEDRAQAVVDALVEEGVAADRLTAQGYGSDEPIESNETEAGREANRRVEITITEGER